ncbi:hypothetical protein J6G99_06005 [bacterium]|nr:hypothetical protein [bacterium]
MYVSKLNSISILDFKNVYGNISDHAKTVLSTQIRDIAYSFKVLYEHYTPDLMLNNKQLLKDLGIEYIGKTMFDGIVFSGEKFRKIVSFPEKGHFNIKFLDNNYTYRVAHELDVYGSKNKYLSSGHSKNDDLEIVVSDVLDEIDSKLFNFRRNIKMPEVKPYIPGMLK